MITWRCCFQVFRGPDVRQHDHPQCIGLPLSNPEIRSWRLFVCVRLDLKHVYTYSSQEEQGALRRQGQIKDFEDQFWDLEMQDLRKLDFTMFAN